MGENRGGMGKEESARKLQNQVSTVCIQGLLFDRFLCSLCQVLSNFTFVLFFCYYRYRKVSVLQLIGTVIICVIWKRLSDDFINVIAVIFLIQKNRMRCGYYFTCAETNMQKHEF